MVIGSIELLPATDAVGTLGRLDELYPRTALDAWAPYRELYPELFAGDSWRVPCTCYIVRSSGTTVLVDTGVGPPGLWDVELEHEGGLLPGLKACGVDPADVDVVVTTHGHVDHVGWNADPDGELVFPNARFAMHADAVEAARLRGQRPHIRRCVLPLLERGLVDLVENGAEIALGVAVVSLPGHDPGHVGLRIGGEAMLIADAAVHPVLLEKPDWLYEFDHDPAVAAETRHALVADLADSGVIVVCGHYPGSGIGRMTRREGRVVWEEAAS